MTAQELATGEPSTEWTEDLEALIKLMNKKKINKPKLTGKPLCEGDSCNVLLEGTKVRAILDGPKDVFGKKLHGKIRSADIKWDPKIRTIKQVLIKPDSPPL